MKRLRLATWAAVAGLGLVSGCQGTNSCGCRSCGCEREGLMSRLGLRPRDNGTVIYGGPAPVEGMAVGALPWARTAPARLMAAAR